MNSFLSHDWAGLAMAAPVAALGWMIFRRGRKLARRRSRWPVMTISGTIGTVATLLSVGAMVHLVQVASDSARFRAPGKLVDVGGYKMHILAEGDNVATAEGRTPTVIWIPGGYGQGLHIYHLHAKMRSHTRSIIYDHAGTGWSDRGPYPRTVEREVHELKALLDRSGEKGPYLVVGHSLGGLLANNFAATFPQDVVGLVSFEATPVSSGEGAQGKATGEMIRKLLTGVAVAHNFGLSFAFSSRGGFPMPKAFVDKERDLLKDMFAPMESRERRAQSSTSAVSILTSTFADPTKLVQAPGALGDLPMLAVHSNLLNVDSWPEEQKAQLKKASGIETEEQWQAMLAALERSDREVADLSRASERVATPAGTTHAFPQEVPDWCFDRVIEFMQRLPSAPAHVAKQN